MKKYFDATDRGERNFRTVVYLLIAALALGLGLSLVSSAHGAGLGQTGGGKITGTATNGTAPAAGISVELRQRNNAGADTLLATTTTDAGGAYTFANQPSAPSDAFYYVRFTGGPNTLSAWYTFPIIYLTGSDFSVPSVDVEDVALVEPASGATIATGSTIKWKARRAGETYRLFVYPEGSTDRAALDSGSLGSGTEYTLPDGSLAEGQYEAVVQVRDTVVGYGQSRAHFHFTIGKAQPAQPPQPAPAAPTDTPQKIETQQAPAPGQPAAAPTSDPSQAAAPSPKTEEQASPTPVPPTPIPPTPVPPTPTQPAPQPTQATQPQQPGSSGSDSDSGTSNSNAPAAKPDVKLHLSADKTSVEQGGSVRYTIEVRNDGSAPAADVIVTDQLPGGLSVDSSQAQSTQGSIAVVGNTVTVQMGVLPPNSTARVDIPVSVGQSVTSNVSNQATAVYNGSTDPVQSNAYVSEVSAPLTGGPDSAPQQPSQQPSGSQPSSGQGSAQGGSAQSPSNSQAGSGQQQPSGGSAGSGTGSGTSKPPAQPSQTPQGKPQASSIPQTGGSFPLVAAILLLLMALVARYLRGVRLRRG